MKTKKEVTKEEFFKALENEKRDVIYNIENVYKYPYNGIFTVRNTRDVWGRSESTNIDENGKRIYPELTKWFLFL